MTRWLVDGMNVIGSRPTGWWRDRQRAQRELVEELERFAGHNGEHLAVVFDGRHHQIPRSREVEVAFAARRGPNAADDEIVALVERDADPRGLTVATSDAELARRVRSAGADVVSAGAFRRLLDERAP